MGVETKGAGRQDGLDRNPSPSHASSGRGDGSLSLWERCFERALPHLPQREREGSMRSMGG